MAKSCWQLALLCHCLSGSELSALGALSHWHLTGIALGGRQSEHLRDERSEAQGSVIYPRPQSGLTVHAQPLLFALCKSCVSLLVPSFCLTFPRASPSGLPQYPSALGPELGMFRVVIEDRKGCHILLPV